MGEVRPLRGKRQLRGAVEDSTQSPPTDDLVALLSRTARGDTGAFTSLYETLAPVVYGVALKVLRDPAQAEEVAQEALVDLWRLAARYDPDRGSVRAWVVTAAHRKAIDRVRSVEASRNREELAGRSSDQPYDMVSETVEHRLAAEQVHRALDVLTDLQREAVTLAYYGGYTQQELARLLDVPLGTVKTRLRDGLIRLRDRMGVEVW